MDIGIRFNLVISLADIETKQLLCGLKYLRHRFTKHIGCGAYQSGCKVEFINQLIVNIENVTKQK